MKYLKKNKWAILGGIAIMLFAMFLQISHNPTLVKFLARVDAIFYDARLTLMLPDPIVVNDNIKIIDIDEKSLEAEGRWPWSRKKIANLIDQLADAGVEAVAFDVIFSEPESNSAEKLIDDLALRGMLEDADKQRLGGFASKVSNDAYLAEHLGATTVILGSVFHNEEQSVGRLSRPMAGISRKIADQLTLPKQPSYAAPLKILTSNAAMVGSVNAEPDNDGILRRSPAILRHGNAIFPSLSLATAMLVRDVGRVKPVFQDDGAGNVNVIGVKYGDYLIPTDRHGHINIAFQGGAYTYEYIPATDVLNGKYANGGLQDVIAFVGTSAAGLLDVRSTPFEKIYPGVETHAVMLDSILSGRVPSKPAFELGAVVVLLVVLGLVMAFIQPILKPAMLIGLSTAVVVALVAGNFYIWAAHLYDITIITPLILVALITLWNVGYSLVRENNQRQMIKSMFGQYVPPQHVDLMLADAKNYNTEGESKELTVMFADVRNFTNISESLTANKLKQALNRYFTPITGAIFDNHGTIDKYVGDMVMAFWGAPIHDDNHRKHAIDAAFAMLYETEKIKPEFAADGLPEFNIGIGLNTGPMNVGDMGSEFRRAYTVLGDSVNLGSRIESLTKFYGAKLMVSEFVMEGVDEYLFLLTDNITVKGKTEAIKVYQPIGLKGEVEPEIEKQVDCFHRALDAYAKQDWDKAIELLNTIEHFAHLRDLYIDRIASLRSQDLGADWDGVYRHTSK